MISLLNAEQSFTIESTVSYKLVTFAAVSLTIPTGLNKVAARDNVSIRRIEFVYPYGIVWGGLASQVILTATGDLAGETDTIFNHVGSGPNFLSNLNEYYAWDATALPTSTKYTLTLDITTYISFSQVSATLANSEVPRFLQVNAEMEHTLALVA